MVFLDVLRKESIMATIDEEVLAEVQAQMAEERRRAGRLEFDNPHLVNLLRRADSPELTGFNEALFARAPARPAPNHLRETIIAALGFWALAFWLLKTCVG